MNEIGADNNGYMFFMNPVWILMMLWTFHACCLLMIYIKDRDDPESKIDKEQKFVYRTFGQTWQNIHNKSCINLWLDEYILLGVYRMAKPWCNRIIRMNIIFTKFYVLLMVPGFLYHFMDLGVDLKWDEANFWPVIFTAVGFSAAAHFFFTMTMNKRITSPGVQQSMYIFMFALWGIIFTAIVAIVAVHDEDLYIIWMAGFVFASLIDFLIMDNIYVLFKLVVLKIGIGSE